MIRVRRTPTGSINRPAKQNPRPQEIVKKRICRIAAAELTEHVGRTRLVEHAEK
jgi:hypothetical protein